jgi:hypothetical protein
VVIDATLALALVLLVGACGGPRRPGRDPWAHARTIAEQHLRDRHTTWTIDAELTGTPYLFRVHTPDAFALLVHDGAVVTQRGLAALDRYLRESRALELRTTTLEEFMVLVQLLDTLPPEPNPRSHFRLSVEGALRPRLDYHPGGRATFHLYYRLPSNPFGGTKAPVGPVIEWTLTMDPGAMPHWSKRQRDYNEDTKAFGDVDHAK